MIATAEPTYENDSVVGYNPTDNAKQVAFHSCPADEVLYGGAAGGGKTAALVNEALQTCLETPGALAIIFRRTSGELDEMIDYSKDLLEPHNIAVYNENKSRWRFKNRSTLRFSHLQFYEDVKKHQGPEYVYIGFDEMTHFMPEQIDFLRTRNRASKSLTGAWPRIRGATNPGNISHIYIRDYYIEPKDATGALVTDGHLIAYWDMDAQTWIEFPPGTRGTPAQFVVWHPEPTEEWRQQNAKRIAQGKRPMPILTRCFIPAFVEDNPYIDEDGAYMSRLIGLPEALKQAQLYGRWDIFDGQFFDAWRTATHVIPPFTPPNHWPKWRSLDWGYDAPLCCLWHTQNPETKQFITYRELYQRRLRDRQACDLILDMTPDDEHIDYTMADPSMQSGDSNDAALSRMETYAKYEVPLLPANNKRVFGWSRVRDVMAMTHVPGSPIEQQPGWVITSNCTNLIRTIPAQVYDDHNTEDLNSDGEDHALDAARYFFASAGTMRTRFTKAPKVGSFNRR